MDLQVFQIIVGDKPLPEGFLRQTEVVKFADTNHVLGQMAHQYRCEQSPGLADAFKNAKLRSTHDHTMLHFEMERVARALTGSGVKAVVLKGGAYVARDLAASRGRRVSDLDILVSPDQLDVTEKLLEAAGWATDEQTDNPYDQHYYREHMHELPPLRHKTRGTIVDVHHSLLPKTARYQVDVPAMTACAEPLGHDGLWSFQMMDIFVHSAVHAFVDGQLDVPVRTLVELNLLFTDLSDKNRTEIVERAKALGAKKAVGLALWAVGHVFAQRQAKEAAKRLVPSYRHLPLKYALLSKAADNAFSPIAKAFLYVRGHFLRMPLYLLVPHLVRKAARWRPGQNLPDELPTP